MPASAASAASACDWLVARIREATERPMPWRERLDAGIAALVKAAAEQPALAKLCLVQGPASGDDNGSQAVVEALVATMAGARESRGGSGHEPPPELEEFVAAAIVSVVSRWVGRGRDTEPAQLQAELTALAAKLWSEPAAPAAGP
jgi:hypothetical protein